MTTLTWMLAALAVFQTFLLLALWRRSGAPPRLPELEERVGRLAGDLERVERGVREEHRTGRAESQAAFTGFDARLGQFTDRTQVRLDKLSETTERRLETIRATLEARLQDLQKDNAAKLEQMRHTVDEKLQSTLEARLGESFKLVSERLEAVHRGLGDMQSLAAGVGDLKRVLGNVKTRGIFGEVQLGAILEQTLTVEQYALNVATVPGSNERVEYAIRLPGSSGDPDKPMWLPIDCKFPREDYERLLDAQERADAEGAAQAGAALERRLREEAKVIAQKYVAPPHTTDFALLFLPTEGLYAEALRRPGLVDGIQRDLRVTVTGPATVSALLNSLRMGFRTLAIEQRSSEVWQVLGAVRTEFGKFGGVLDKVRKQIATVGNTLEDTSRRSRAIERKLRTVESATETDAQRLLGEALGVADPEPGEDEDAG